MREPTPLHEIRVPEPKLDDIYTARVLDREVTFAGLKRLLGAADYSKAGDRQAGLAAGAEDVREAAHGPLGTDDRASLRASADRRSRAR